MAEEETIPILEETDEAQAEREPKEKERQKNQEKERRENQERKRRGKREKIAMKTTTTTMNRPPERGGGKAETSFIEGNTQRMRISTSGSIKLQVTNEKLAQMHPNYGKDGKFLTLEELDEEHARVKSDIGKVAYVGKRGGRTVLFNADGALNPKLPLEAKKKYLA